MDSSLQQTPDLSKLSDKDKQELQQFIVNETQKARIQQCMCVCLFVFLSFGGWVWMVGWDEGREGDEGYTRRGGRKAERKGGKARD